MSDVGEVGGAEGVERIESFLSETDPHGMRAVMKLDGGAGGDDDPAWESLEGSAGMWVLLSLVAVLTCAAMVVAKVAGWGASWWWCAAPVVFFYGMVFGAIVTVRRAGLGKRPWM